MTYRWFTLACCSLLLVAASVSAWDCTQCLGITESYIESYIGFREDGLKWKVKSKHNNPLVATEFCFDDVKMVEKGLSSRVTFCDQFVLKADGNFSLAYNKAHDWAFDLAVAIGHHFDLCNCTLRLTPFVGYAIDRERFYSCEENFLSDFANEGGFTFILSQLDTYYRAHWNSPFVGFDLHYAINDCWKVYTDFAYQFVNLRGKGRSTLGNFKQTGFEIRDQLHQRSHGWGFTWDTGIQYALDSNWRLDLGTQFEYRRAHHGHQHTHHQVKQSPTEAADPKSDESKNRIKHVEWRSLHIGVGLSYRF